MHKTIILYNRLLKFSQFAFNLINTLPKGEVSTIIIKQIIRSTTSVGANYSESLESSTIKDRSFKINIARKEAKETTYWLDIISLNYKTIDIKEFKNESIELTKILATIQRILDT